MVQLAPPLIAGDAELDVIADEAAHGPCRSLRPLLHLRRRSETLRQCAGDAAATLRCWQSRHEPAGEANLELVLEYLDEFGTFDPEQYDPYLAEEPTYMAGMNIRRGVTRSTPNTDAGRILYPRPEEALTARSSPPPPPATGCRSSSSGAPHQQGRGLREPVRPVLRGERRQDPHPGRDARLPGLSREVRPVRAGGDDDLTHRVAHGPRDRSGSSRSATPAPSTSATTTPRPHCSIPTARSTARSAQQAVRRLPRHDGLAPRHRWHEHARARRSAHRPRSRRRHRTPRHLRRRLPGAGGWRRRADCARRACGTSTTWSDAKARGASTTASRGCSGCASSALSAPAGPGARPWPRPRGW